MDIFDRIEWGVREIFGEGLTCVHVGNVEECDIKRHPTYPKFRSEAIKSGIRSASTSRLWESLITMGRLSDMENDDTWRLVVLDCIVPSFRPLSARIAREFRADRDEIRSTMVAVLLETWENTGTGVSPRQVRDRMAKTAIDAAFHYGKSGSSEYSIDEIEIFSQLEIPTPDFVMKESSIIDVNSIRDAITAEQIRGERIGALFQDPGRFEAVRVFHDDLRSGRRSGSVGQAVKTSGMPRSRISDPNLYYYTSDLYPSYIGLREAADVMGIAESAAHRLIRAGQFPFPVARAGRSYRVSVKALMHFMEIQDVIVHVDDVENGALHAGGKAQ
ncbi:helix-turn-helix transcriptional regulator [Streptomyces sp. NPDC088757]|uniref:helix-turn-helix transcriptional regulator n=1 Tax=Streptomyces sp. NPDC088757 TaxID=3365889 RepID=UPI003823F281